MEICFGIIGLIIILWLRYLVSSNRKKSKGRGSSVFRSIIEVLLEYSSNGKKSKGRGSSVFRSIIEVLLQSSSNRKKSKGRGSSIFRSIIEVLLGASSNRKKPKVARKVESARRIKKRDIWIPQNENIIVAGRNIGGMIYSGYREDKKWEGQGDPVIDKTLSVARVGTGAGDRDLQPPLSYSTIDPKQRAAYLNWLRSGRSQKQNSAGYILRVWT